MKLRFDWSKNYHLLGGDGKSRKERLLPALKKDYFNVTELRFQALLALAVEYAQVMKFYNLNNQEDGTWGHFFSLDETVVIAEILTVDLDKLMTGAAYDNATARVDDELMRTLRALPEKEIGRHIMSSYNALRLLDQWLQRLARGKNSTATELRKVVESVIIGLIKHIYILVPCLSQYAPSHLLKIFSDDLIDTLKRYLSHYAPSHLLEKIPDDLIYILVHYLFKYELSHPREKIFSGDLKNLLKDILKRYLSGYGPSHSPEKISDDLIDILESYLRKYAPNHPLEKISSDDLMKLLPVSKKTISGHAKTVVDVSIHSSSHAFVKAIEMVQGSAEKLLSASLASKDHEPAAALLLAFLQLFQKLHNKVNRFTLDYVDFYYDRVLKVQPRGFTPDHVYLVLVPNKKNHKVPIPAGTEFLARRDENERDIVYATNEDVAIGDAVVSAVHTLFFERDPLDFPENELCEQVVLNDRAGKVKRQLATGGWWNDVTVAKEDSPLDENILQPYPLFGAPNKSRRETILGKPARIGFALASKVLWLQEGRRTVTIHMKYADGSGNEDMLTLKQWIGKIAVAIKSTEDASIREQQAFFKAFRDVFIISLSTEGGWREIPEYSLSCSCVDQQQEENSLAVTFFLPENFPAVVSYDPDIHGEDYETGLPVVRLVLNPKSYVYPYGILSKLVLDRIRIDVAVEGCRMLRLHNNIGQLSPLVPFAPFGPLPEVGSYLVVGCPEAAVKQLSDFDVEIQWGGLPAGIGGFKTHYQGYEAFDDTNFRVSTTLLSNGKWQPENAKAAVVDSLFQLKANLTGGSEVSTYRKLSCAPVISYWSPYEYLTEFSFTPATHKGFFKFTLTAPGQAFGHREYPIALANALTFNAMKKHAKFPKKAPNPPYTPMITSLAVNYKASAQMVMGKEEVNYAAAMRDRMIHLHPLGWKNAALADQDNYLLPQFLHSGNLLIGLKGFTGGAITLYFCLRENSLPLESLSLKEMQWFYLANNQWFRLSTKEIMSDSTQWFMHSGIVTLNIPAKITQDNTVLPAGLSWLRVSYDRDLGKFCSLYSIHAQALKASRQVENDRAHSDSIRLPAGAVSRARKSIPGIVTIKQIQPSFGGRLVEDRDHLRIRVSERLKHKNRALLPADYELLILDRFPQISKVKCFPGMKPDFVNKHLDFVNKPRFGPGHVLIVVVPYLAENETVTQKPFLNGYLINEIQEFINRYVPPFVTAHIINPVYEVIQVRCTVKLKKPLLAGLHLEHLNRAISDFLSPWKDTFGDTRHFGWIVSKHDIESFIKSRDYVDRVTNLSILRIVPKGKSEDSYYLLDSEDKPEASEVKDIIPFYPWSIVAPIQQHFIEMDDCYDLIEPKITGIGKLEIGSTFIISDEKWRKKIEKH